MQINAGIPLAGQTPDIIGNMARGQQAAQFANDAGHTNALRSMMQEQGPGIMRGDQNALAELSRFDPTAALGVQQTRQSMAQSQERMQMARAAAARQAASWAQQQDERTIAAEREGLERGLRGAAYFYSQGDREGYESFLTQQGMDPAQYQFDQFPALAAMGEGILETLQTFQPQSQPEPAQIQTLRIRASEAGLQPGTPEYQRFMANGGRLEESETIFGPDGQPIVQRGTGSRPSMTDAQSRNAIFSTRARGALEDLEPVADSLLSRFDILADSVPMGFGREFQDDEYQRARVAGDEFLMAILRKDTGAAITSSERTEYGGVYLPQPGDSPEVLELRRVARRRALAALEAGMGEEEMAAQTRALRQVVESAGGGGGARQGSPAVPDASQTPAASPAAPRSEWPSPTVADEQLLRSDPSPEAQREFDEIFGPGSAENMLRWQ